MTGTFRDLYAAELEYLYGLAEELGEEHARIAPILGRDVDPGVARLAQNVAFLSAKVRQRLDDDLPDVVHPVIESLCPWLLRPLPSATIVELTPDPAMQEALVAPAGSVFATRSGVDAPCHFRSSQAVDVRPWSLDGVEVANERTEVRLRLSLLPGAASAPLQGALRVYLAMPIAAALELRSHLARSTTAVIARPAGSPGAEVTLAEAGHVLGGGEATWDHELDGPAADPHFILRAYFTWPEQFAFVEIPRLDRLRTLGAKVRAFELVVRLGVPLPSSLNLDAAALRLHCVAAVNVRRAPAVTAPLVGRRCALAVRDGEIYSIRKVTLVRDDLSTLAAHPYARFFPPTLAMDGRLPVSYRVLRTGSVLGPNVDLSLDFVNAEGSGVPSDAVSVDVELLATDGDRAARVGVGDVRAPTSSSPSLMSFRNITPVTRSGPPFTTSDRLWRWFQFLKTSFAQLADRSSLAEALALANVAACARWPQSKENGEVLEAILSVGTRRLARAGHDEMFPGVRVEVALNEEHFASRGDIDLFGECLATLLASTLRAHEWMELALRDAVGTLLYEYVGRFGTRVGP